MESISYIKLHRRLLQWEWYKNHTVKDLFIHCLCRANFSEQSFEGMTIKRGQFVTSIKSLADELGFTEQQIRTALKKLKLTNEITSNVTNEQQADLMNKLLIGLEALKMEQCQ